MEWGDGAGSKNAEPCSTAAVGRGTIAEAILLGRAMQWGKGENLFFLPLTSSALSTARCGWKPTDNLQGSGPNIRRMAGFRIGRQLLNSQHNAPSRLCAFT